MYSSVMMEDFCHAQGDIAYIQVLVLHVEALSFYCVP